MITKLFPLYEVGGFITGLVGTILAEISVYIWLRIGKISKLKRKVGNKIYWCSTVHMSHVHPA